MRASSPVYILVDRPELPIYHRRGYSIFGGDNAGAYSVCGKLLMLYKSGSYPRGTRLRLGHARFFARPCKQCWPPSSAVPTPAPITAHLAWRTSLR